MRQLTIIVIVVVSLSNLKDQKIRLISFPNKVVVCLKVIVKVEDFYLFFFTVYSSYNDHFYRTIFILLTLSPLEQTGFFVFSCEIQGRYFQYVQLILRRILDDLSYQSSGRILLPLVISRQLLHYICSLQHFIIQFLRKL